MFKTSSLTPSISAQCNEGSVHDMACFHVSMEVPVKTDFILFFLRGVTATEAHGSPTHSISIILEFFLSVLMALGR